MISIYVIGCGGIGGYLIERLPMAISSLSLDVLDSIGLDISRYLNNAGAVALPSLVDRVVMVDGDTFNPRNAIRQGAGAGSKLAQRLRTMKQDMINVTYLQNVRYYGYNEYINPGNMEQIIPHAQAANNDNDSSVYARYSTKINRSLIKDTPVVFLCVDNAKTRYEVSVYMETFDNCLVINGGNEKTKGHVTVYERCNGAALDPALYDLYPDINPTSDKRPDEDCTVVSPKHDQIATTNSVVADVMMSMLSRWARGKTGLTQQVTSRGVTRDMRYNEVLIDMEALTMTPLENLIHKKEGN